MLTEKDILYSDRYVSVVNKPAGLQTEPDKMGHPDLCTELKKWMNKAGQTRTLFQPVNRLDRPVSGLVLFGHTASAVKALNAQQENRTIQKTYHALVEGLPNPSRGVWTHFIEKNRLRKRAFVFREQKTGAKPCTLEYEMLERRDDKTKLSIRLKTGRYHQIRAQASFCGHPIVGDFLYGSSVPFHENSIALHAFRLVFNHPKNGEQLVFSVDPGF